MLGQNTAAIAIIVIIFIAIAVSFFTKSPKSYDKSRMKIFVTILAGLGIFITFFFYYNVVELQYDQQKMMIYDRLESIDNTLVDKFLDVSKQNSSSDFVRSLFPIQFPGLESGDDSDEFLKLYVSNIVFQSWKDFLNYYPYVVKKSNERGFLIEFLQRAQSQNLEVIWYDLKISHSEHVREFGDIIFRFSKEILTATGDEFERVAGKFLEDPEYRDLIVRNRMDLEESV